MEKERDTTGQHGCCSETEEANGRPTPMCPGHWAQAAGLLSQHNPELSCCLLHES